MTILKKKVPELEAGLEARRKIEALLEGSKGLKFNHK